MGGSEDGDREYLERTADRLRTMSASQVDLTTADAAEVRSRLERMAYGGSRLRNRGASTVPGAEPAQRREEQGNAATGTLRLTNSGDDGRSSPQ